MPLFDCAQPIRRPIFIAFNMNTHKDRIRAIQNQQDLVPFVVGVGNAWTLATGILIFCWVPALDASASPAAALAPVSWTGLSDELSFRVTFPATLSDMGLTCRRRAVTWNSTRGWSRLCLYKRVLQGLGRVVGDLPFTCKALDLIPSTTK